MLISVQPDKEMIIAEERIRLTAPADLPADKVFGYISKDLLKTIDDLQRTSGYWRIDLVPARQHFGTINRPCCAKMLLPPGTKLPIRIEVSALQADIDELDESVGHGNQSDFERVFKDNKRDYVAIVHFWKPALFINRAEREEFKEQVFNEKHGFVSDENMPDMTPITKKDPRWFKDKSGKVK